MSRSSHGAILYDTVLYVFRNPKVLLLLAGLLVTAQLPGANPETMGASVATPLENQFSTISGLEQMTSVNSLGSSQITLEFALDRSLDGASRSPHALERARRSRSERS